MSETYPRISIFPSHIALLCTHDVEVLAQKNNLAFVEMLEIYSVIELNTHIRDYNGNAHAINNMYVKFNEMKNQNVQPLIARKLLNESVSKYNLYQKSALDYNYNIENKEFSIPLGNINKSLFNINFPLSAPWFEQYKQTFFNVMVCSDHEFLRHYLACLFVVSCNSQDPLRDLENLIQQQREHQGFRSQVPPFTNTNSLSVSASHVGTGHKWFCQSVFHFHVLLYDPSECEEQRALGLYENMKNMYGSHACHFLRLNDTDSNLSTSMRTDEPLLPTLNGELPIQLNSLQDALKEDNTDGSHPLDQLAQTQNLSNPTPYMEDTSSQPSLSPGLLKYNDENLNLLSAGNQAAMSGLVKDFCVKGLIPWAERHMRLWNEQIQSRRGLLSKSIISATKKWFGVNLGGGTSNATLNAPPPSGISHQPVMVSLNKPTHALKTIANKNNSILTLNSNQNQNYQPLNTSNSSMMSKSATLSSLGNVGMKSLSSSSSSTNTMHSSLSTTSVLYNQDSIELQSRQLADLCFLFQCYSPAYQLYHSVKKDFQSDQAWIYYAGAIEMAGVTSFLMNTPLNQYPHHYIESAINTYLNVCNLPIFAIRSTLISTEILKWFGLYTQSALQYLKLTSEDSDLRSALFLEQSALCFLKVNSSVNFPLKIIEQENSNVLEEKNNQLLPNAKFYTGDNVSTNFGASMSKVKPYTSIGSLIRKYAFYMVLAGNKYLKIADENIPSAMVLQTPFTNHNNNNPVITTPNHIHSSLNMCLSFKRHGIRCYNLANQVYNILPQLCETSLVISSDLRDRNLHHSNFYSSSNNDIINVEKLGSFSPYKGNEWKSACEHVQFTLAKHYRSLYHLLLANGVHKRATICLNESHYHLSNLFTPSLSTLYDCNMLFKISQSTTQNNSKTPFNYHKNINNLDIYLNLLGSNVKNFDKLGHQDNQFIIDDNKSNREGTNMAIHVSTNQTANQNIQNHIKYLKELISLFTDYQQLKNPNFRLSLPLPLFLSQAIEVKLADYDIEKQANTFRQSKENYHFDPMFHSHTFYDSLQFCYANILHHLHRQNTRNCDKNYPPHIPKNILRAWTNHIHNNATYNDEYTSVFHNEPFVVEIPVLNTAKIPLVLTGIELVGFYTKKESTFTAINDHILSFISNNHQNISSSKHHLSTSTSKTTPKDGYESKLNTSLWAHIPNRIGFDTENSESFLSPDNHNVYTSIEREQLFKEHHFYNEYMSPFKSIYDFYENTNEPSQKMHFHKILSEYSDCKILGEAIELDLTNTDLCIPPQQVSLIKLSIKANQVGWFRIDGLRYEIVFPFTNSSATAHLDTPITHLNSGQIMPMPANSSLNSLVSFSQPFWCQGHRLNHSNQQKKCMTYSLDKRLQFCVKPSLPLITAKINPIPFVMYDGQFLPKLDSSLAIQALQSILPFSGVGTQDTQTPLYNMMIVSNNTHAHIINHNNILYSSDNNFDMLYHIPIPPEEINTATTSINNTTTTKVVSTISPLNIGTAVTKNVGTNLFQKWLPLGLHNDKRCRTTYSKHTDNIANDANINTEKRNMDVISHSEQNLMCNITIFIYSYTDNMNELCDENGETKDILPINFRAYTLPIRVESHPSLKLSTRILLKTLKLHDPIPSQITEASDNIAAQMAFDLLIDLTNLTKDTDDKIMVIQIHKMVLVSRTHTFSSTQKHLGHSGIIEIKTNESLRLMLHSQNIPSKSSENGPIVSDILCFGSSSNYTPFNHCAPSDNFNQSDGKESKIYEPLYNIMQKDWRKLSVIDNASKQRTSLYAFWTSLIIDEKGNRENIQGIHTISNIHETNSLENDKSRTKEMNNNYQHLASVLIYKLEYKPIVNQGWEMVNQKKRIIPIQLHLTNIDQNDNLPLLITVKTKNHTDFNYAWVEKTEYNQLFLSSGQTKLINLYVLPFTSATQTLKIKSLQIIVKQCNPNIQLTKNAASEYINNSNNYTYIGTIYVDNYHVNIHTNIQPLLETENAYSNENELQNDSVAELINANLIQII